jgi:hypothetical protein|tara:strand:- start:74 stop:616 length:543 start_codon:yes stop_codon:yes gene_type:complete
MKELIRKILKEETSPNEKETIQDLIKDFGYETAIKYLGGLDNFINIMYDGDLIKFSEDTTTPIVYLSADGMNLYLHTTLVDQLGLENVNSSASTFSRPKTLGKFRYGSKNDIPYAFTANLEPTRLHNIYYKVVGSSGDSGFGYNFITKRNTLSKRYRQQIFKQIIDKYDLEPYMKVKTFY